MIDLNGKKVLVTGASGGIGKAIAMELSSSGADLCLTGRNESELENFLNGAENQNVFLTYVNSSIAPAPYHIETNGGLKYDLNTELCIIFAP